MTKTSTADVTLRPETDGTYAIASRGRDERITARLRRAVYAGRKATLLALMPDGTVFSARSMRSDAGGAAPASTSWAIA